jgi:hypothetical protein
MYRHAAQVRYGEFATSLAGAVPAGRSRPRGGAREQNHVRTTATMLMAALRARERRRLAVIYGLDWIAAVLPTVALCRQHFGDDGVIMFGWVLASHHVGADLVALGAGAHSTRTSRSTRGLWPITPQTAS